MKKITRMMSVLLVIVVLLSALSGVSFAAQKNTGTRHTLCTSLSSQATSYYKTNDFTYDEYAAMDGGTTSCLTAVNSELFKELHNLMDDTMTASISYNSLTSYWKDTDCEKGTSNATLFYSDFTSSSYNREHVWPKSRASFHQQDGGCDIHHLRPTNSPVNSTRSNYTMGNVREVCNSYERKENGGNTVLWYNGSYSGNGSHGLVEVKDDVKGDVARIFLYVYVRWEERNLFENDPNPKQASNDSGGNNGWKVIYDLETLLEWCEMDPVDTWEMSRNDACQSVQGNRNVFIDYPEFAWLIFGQEIPDDMVTPSGEAKNSSKFNITARSNNEDYGTVVLDGKTVTAYPKTGYEVEGYTLTPSDAAAVTYSGNTFKLSKVTADCTLTVNFKAKVAASITYNVPAGVSANGVTEGYVGDSITLATVSGKPSDASAEYTFFGWSGKPIDRTTSKPSVKAAGSSYQLADAETTFYAVFSYNDNGTTYYLSNFCQHESTHETRIEPTCDKAGAVQTVCDDCGYVLESVSIAKLGHDYEITTIEPTCTDKGYDHYVCARCGDDYKKNYTDKVDHKDDDGNNACDYCGESLQTEPPVCPCEQFSDISEGEWYYDAIAFVVENGLMNGVGEGKFAPNDSLTRAMLVTILYRTMDAPSVDEPENPFTDVAAEQWYTNAIIWAANNGIVNGVSETTFAPDASITREQIATIVYRYASKLGYDISASADIAAYPDAKTVSGYALDAMQWAVGSGMINGIDGNLAPTETATRAQLATMLMRFIDWCNDNPIIVE